MLAGRADSRCRHHLNLLHRQKFDSDPIYRFPIYRFPFTPIGSREEADYGFAYTENTRRQMQSR